LKTIKKYFKRLLKILALLTIFSIILFMVGLLLPQATLTAGNHFQTLVINNVSVVDVKNGEIIAAQNILIKDNLIKIISSEPLNKEKNATIIDGTDKFIMPGLWDMHGHFIHHSPQLHFPLLVAHGVTHVREMGFGSPADNLEETILMSLKDRDQWRTQIKKQNLIGPYICASAVYQIEEFSDIWDNEEQLPPLEEILKLFTRLKQEGVDFIKITLENNPPKKFFYSIMQAAEQVGLDVVGHKPRRVSAVDASNLGMKSFEHARFLAIESSSLRDTYINGSFKGKGKHDVLYRNMIDSFDPQLAEDTFQTFKKNNTWYCPTHITRRWEANYDNEAYRADERVKYVPYILRSIWSLDAFIMSKKVPSKILYDFYEHGLTITKQAFDSGVRLLAGSDMLDPYAFFGSGLWDELSEFDKAGIPVKDILRIATIDSATFLNQQSLFGSVEEGKVADLLLLGNNPLENISNLESLEVVFVHQKLYGQNDLSNMKTYVADIATSWAFTSEQLLVTMKSFL
jgi:hypothetical protein